MTEKRFTVVYNEELDTSFIEDTESKYDWHISEAEALLNSFDEDCKELQKENEQLKDEINMLKITIKRNESYIKSISEKSKWSN